MTAIVLSVVGSIVIMLLLLMLEQLVQIRKTLWRGESRALRGEKP